MSDVVLYEKRGHTAIITINRPEKMNSVSAEVQQGFWEVWTRFRDDPDAWTAILTGAGDKSFCAGGDLRENLARARGEMPALPPTRPGVGRVGYSSIARHLEIWKPVIGAVNGFAMGGGFAVALSCDIRICSPNARFGCSEVRWSHMAGGQAFVLPRTLPMGWAMWLNLTGQAIDAETALRIGLVQAIVPQEKLMDEALALADTINANGRLVAQHTKEFIFRSMDVSLSSAAFMEGMFYDHLRRSPDYDEGTASFVEKRQRQYTGREE